MLIMEIEHLTSSDVKGKHKDTRKRKRNGQS